MAETIEVVLVTSPGCHFCDDALSLLNDLAERTPLNLETVPLNSDLGRSLLVQHRVPFPPILVVGGEFFGYGRISRRQLEACLADRLARGQVS